MISYSNLALLQFHKAKPDSISSSRLIQRIKTNLFKVDEKNEKKKLMFLLMIYKDSEMD
jgi:hypothetical protein